MNIPEPWSVLDDEESGDQSIVVPGSDTDVIDAILTLVEETYGGPQFSRDNPAILKAASESKVQVWRRCSREQAINEYNADPDAYNSFWAPNGGGPEEIFVVSICLSGYNLGELAELAETVLEELVGSDE